MIKCSASTDFAVVIGISQYPHLRTLQGPVQDATQFRDWLLDYADVPSDNIHFIIGSEPPDPPESRPIQDEIDTAFNTIFIQAKAATMRAPRRLYVYFAGHGCSQTFTHLALLMANASEDCLGYSLDAEDYHKGLAHLAYFTEQIFFYDCCRNFDRLVIGRGHPWTLRDPNNNPRDPSDVMQYVLYGAGFTEFAHERVLEYSTRRGLFTKALIEGLTEGGVEESIFGGWVVTTDSLYPYVNLRLNELAKDQGVKQNLNRRLAGRNAVLTLATVCSAKTFTVGVTAKKYGDIVVRNHALREVGRQSVSNVPLDFNLITGKYTFTLISPGNQNEEKTESIGPGLANSINL